MAEWSVRRATPADLPAIVQLLERSFGKPRSAELFRWKHQQNPFGASPCLLAEVDGSPVCLRAFLRWRWLANGREVPAMRAVDTATHPEWRRRGLFSQLTRQLVEEVRMEGVAFVFNTPGRASLPGYLQLGWRKVGRLPLLVRPLRPLRSARRLLTGRAKDLQAPQLAALPTVEELLAHERLEDLLTGAAKAGASRRYQTARTRSYLRWRYVAIPGYDYRALWRLPEGAGAALICHARLRRGHREIKISELLLGPGQADRKCAVTLLDELSANADADYLVSCAAARTSERAVFRQAGFLPATVAGPVLTALVLNLGSDSPDPLQASSWRGSLGDFEVF